MRLVDRSAIQQQFLQPVQMTSLTVASTEDPCHIAIDIPRSGYSNSGIQTNLQLLPCRQTLLHASKLSLQLRKSIYLDYYMDTYKQTAFIGESMITHEKILIKSSDEFTSRIKTMYKVDTDYIVLTENSIYILHGNVQKRKLTIRYL